MLPPRTLQMFGRCLIQSFGVTAYNYTDATINFARALNQNILGIGVTRSV